jgi:hypothetical protein
MRLAVVNHSSTSTIVEAEQIISRIVLIMNRIESALFETRSVSLAIFTPCLEEQVLCYTHTHLNLSYKTSLEYISMYLLFLVGQMLKFFFLNLIYELKKCEKFFNVQSMFFYV